MEKYCLEWNEFQDSLLTSVSDLCESSKYEDLSLICEGGDRVFAHKILLSASSPFFAKVLDQMDNSTKSCIYMRGVNARILSSLLNFIYKGKAYIPQDDLDSFLTLAKDLELKGLTKPDADQSGQNNDVFTEQLNIESQSKIFKESHKRPNTVDSHTKFDLQIVKEDNRDTDVPIKESFYEDRINHEMQSSNTT